ncbi:MAG: WD40/YVTN/BNR-like repeat-containing protein [Rhodothermales bacterium]
MRTPRRSVRFACFLVLFSLSSSSALAQQADSAATPAKPSAQKAAPVAPTPAQQRLAAFEGKAMLQANSLVRNVPFRNIGPTVMSGRVVDVDISPDDPSHFYVAYASGGLWKTTSGGTAFTPLFDDQATMTLGDIAVNWEEGEMGSETIWAGTGENNSSRSSYAGTGVYKSTDGGQTWQHKGLQETHRTGRIILHPSDSNTVWVAAAGALYSPSPERGVYKTSDGGETWQKTLFINDTTGVIDLVIDPENPDVLYAATWHRERRAWDFVEAGAGSGIHKSTDGGATWREISTEESGLPTGPDVGRIGLAIHTGDPGVLYALIDNQARRPEEEGEEMPALTREMLRQMAPEDFLEVGEAALEDYLERNGFPASYTVQSILEMVEAGELEPIALVEYLEDANESLFETPVIGAEVYRSEDGGATWQKTHDDYLDNVYYSYGYYFGEIRVAPDDPERIYIMGVPILKSEDGGKTFTSIGAPNVHGDHHALWVSSSRPGHLINGNDGGLNISFDDGASWFKANTPSVGQFYAIAVDEAEPYRVYGGLQDNGVWGGPHTYEAGAGWQGDGDYPYNRLLGGDGMQVEVDTRTNDIVYTGFQFGNYFRINQATGERTSIKPEHDLGERPFRFNWQVPIHLSRHNPDVLYLGSQKLHRSLDQGETWEALSEDLTQGGREGDVPYGTLTTIDESPLRFGLLYTGSDDGLLHVSRDGGFSWTDVSGNLPEDLWVSRVAASHHEEGRVYAALNGYRWDDFTPYLYRSDDYGASWTRFGEGLPMEPVNAVLEDPANADVLYVGTDGGLYVSLDRGQTFMTMQGGGLATDSVATVEGVLPNVPVHDLKIQAREKHLVVGTHGRSIYVADVQHVQALTPDLLAESLHLFALDSLVYDEDWGETTPFWEAPRAPEVVIPFYSKTSGTSTIRILTEGDTLVQEIEAEAVKGLNYVPYHLTADSARVAEFVAPEEGEDQEEENDVPTMEPAENGAIYLVPGTYTVEVALGEATARGVLRVNAPPEPDVRTAPRPEEGEETY